jgi:predicted Zn-dependent peptidase
MQIIENLKVKEKLYIEKLANGLTIMIIPKKNIQKKYVIFGTNFGSIDNHFIVPNTNEEVSIPDGVAHFLEHKMFEQESGVNSLDTLSALGVEANAYTTNDHTAYLFETTENFYEALDELMDYVQHPYFTDENVEKEKGIIGQEIKMYEDHPGWQVYLNTMKCMYKENPVRKDIAGSIESISEIDKDILYKCYNTFYNLSNMAMVVCGDFEPEKLLEEIKSRIIEKNHQAEIKRIYPEKEDKILQKEKTVKMEVNTPLFMIGFKDNEGITENIVKKHIAIEILLNMLLGQSSDLYKELYEQGYLIAVPDLDYEFSKQYAHVLISSQSKSPKDIVMKLMDKINKLKTEGINEAEFTRIKKKIYGDYVTEYNSVSEIARMFLADYFKGINSFDYLENYNLITADYAKQVLEEIFKDENMVVSIVEPN